MQKSGIWKEICSRKCQHEEERSQINCPIFHLQKLGGKNYNHKGKKKEENNKD